MARQQAASPSAAGLSPRPVVGERMVEMAGNFGRSLKEGRTRLVIGVGAAGPSPAP